VIVPEDIVEHVDGYAPEHWDYPHRCADVELALIVAREKVEEWDRVADPRDGCAAGRHVDRPAHCPSRQ
jgi:hypothetical protein